jgi:hypothetical protein
MCLFPMWFRVRLVTVFCQEFAMQCGLLSVWFLRKLLIFLVRNEGIFIDQPNNCIINGCQVIHQKEKGCQVDFLFQPKREIRRSLAKKVVIGEVESFYPLTYSQLLSWLLGFSVQSVSINVFENMSTCITTAW